MFTWTLASFANMEHNVLLVLFTRPLVLSLYILVYLCFIARHANNLFTTSLNNWGPVSKTILNGVPNRIKIRSYESRATSYFTKDFKACISANFMKWSLTNTMNWCPLLVIGNGPIKSTPHFSKGHRGGMGCKKPFIVDICA